MKEYRAQLDADRAKRLSKGTNHADLRVKADDMKSKVSDPPRQLDARHTLAARLTCPMLHGKGCLSLV